MSKANLLYVKCNKLLVALIKDDKSTEFFGPMVKMAESALQNNDVAFLKRLLKELLTIARDFPHRVSLDLLSEVSSSASMEGSIISILRRGSILDSEEMRVAEEYMDLIFQDPGKEPIVKRLEGLIYDFKTRGKGAAIG